MNKKLLVLVAVAAVSIGAFARPHGGGHHGGPRGGHHSAPAMHHGGPRHHGGGHHHGHHGYSWGHGGRNFWPGFIGGAVGALVYDAVTTPSPVVVTTPVVTTPVVTTPIVTTQNIWVEGRYVDQVQPNGVIIRVWQPGHYEQRTVYVQ